MERSELAAHYGRILAEQERTGASMREFAESYGVTPATLYAWRRRLREDGESSGGLIAVDVLDAELSTRSSSQYEIALPSGVTIRASRVSELTLANWKRLFAPETARRPRTRAFVARTADRNGVQQLLRFAAGRFRCRRSSIEAANDPAVERQGEALDRRACTRLTVAAVLEPLELASGTSTLACQDGPLWSAHSESGSGGGLLDELGDVGIAERRGGLACSSRGAARGARSSRRGRLRTRAHGSAG